MLINKTISSLFIALNCSFIHLIMSKVRWLKCIFFFFFHAVLLSPRVTGHVPLCAGLLFPWGRGSLSPFVVLDVQGEASTLEGKGRGAVVKYSLP